jgi:hypothetical protein
MEVGNRGWAGTGKNGPILHKGLMMSFSLRPETLSGAGGRLSLKPEALPGESERLSLRFGTFPGENERVLLGHEALLGESGKIPLRTGRISSGAEAVSATGGWVLPGAVGVLPQEEGVVALQPGSGCQRPGRHGMPGWFQPLCWIVQK